MSKMTTSQLTTLLKQADPEGNREVEFPIYTYTQRYPQAYIYMHAPHHDGRHFGVENFGDNITRISLHLPKGMSIQNRQKDR